MLAQGPHLENTNLQSLLLPSLTCATGCNFDDRRAVLLGKEHGGTKPAPQQVPGGENYGGSVFLSLPLMALEPAVELLVGFPATLLQTLPSTACFASCSSGGWLTADAGEGWQAGWRRACSVLVSFPFPSAGLLSQQQQFPPTSSPGPPQRCQHSWPVSPPQRTEFQPLLPGSQF